jgi:hypothetical protein
VAGGNLRGPQQRDSTANGPISSSLSPGRISKGHGKGKKMKKGFLFISKGKIFLDNIIA